MLKHLADEAVEVDGRGLLSVHRDDVAARLGKVRHALVRLHNHPEPGHLSEQSAMSQAAKPTNQPSKPFGVPLYLPLYLKRVLEF